MCVTNNLRDQHQRAEKLIQEMEGYLKNPTHYSNELKSCLFKLTGILKIHLVAEDKVLYPKLINHSSSEISVFAQKAKNDMGPLSTTYLSYSDKWIKSNMIKEHSQEFISDTQNVFSALKNRINFENTELYPLMENN